MKIFYTKKHKDHNPPFEIYDGVKEPYAENAERLDSIVKALRGAGIEQLNVPQEYSLRLIHALHDIRYASFLRERAGSLKKTEVLYPSYFIMDTYTPITRGTYAAAKQAVDVALSGAGALLCGEQVVYSLCRPPGHHAERKAMAGYCYFNNAAIAAEYLSQRGKVAILDVDFHHGNGTQHLFYERSDVFYLSIHANPEVKFPYNSGFVTETGKGEGVGFTKNYPLPLGVSDNEYLSVLRDALHTVLAFQPMYLVVSLGFDTYEKDPIGGFGLTIPFYHTMAKEIAALSLPTLLIQEGGYHVEDLGKMAVSFLSGFENFPKDE